MKEAKLRAKQAQEMELLQGRGARGRDQLKRAHAQVMFHGDTCSVFLPGITTYIHHVRVLVHCLLVTGSGSLGNQTTELSDTVAVSFSTLYTGCTRQLRRSSLRLTSGDAIKHVQLLPADVFGKGALLNILGQCGLYHIGS